MYSEAGYETMSCTDDSADTELPEKTAVVSRTVRISVIGLYRFGSPLRITVVGANRQPGDDSRGVPDSLSEKHHPKIVMRFSNLFIPIRGKSAQRKDLTHVATLWNDPTSECRHDP